jgi:hypothetical protein
LPNHSVTNYHQKLPEAPDSSVTAQEGTWQLTPATPSSCSAHLLIYLKQLFHDITPNLKFFLTVMCFSFVGSFNQNLSSTQVMCGPVITYESAINSVQGG